MAAIQGEISAVNPTYKFKWVIQDFRLDSRRVGEAIKSPDFNVTNINDKYNWQLLLYPRGNIENHKEYCSVCFINRHRSKSFRGTVTLSLVDVKGKVVRETVITDKIFSPGQVKGNPRFFSRRYIANTENRVLNDGTLTVVCEITIGAKKQEKEEGDEDMKADDEQMDVQEEKKEDNNAESELRLREFDDFEHLVDEKAFSDVIFIVGGNTLYAHKCILSTRSPVFAAMFLHEMREKLENKVEVKDIDYDVFREMLRFVYTGKVNRFDLAMAYDLLIAADRYSLDSLKSMSEKKVCEGFTKNTALGYLQLADRYRAKVLRGKAIEFIIDNANVIINSAEFKTLPNDLVIEICGAMATKIK